MINTAAIAIDTLDYRLFNLNLTCAATDLADGKLTQ
jgi:hypothetical protein